MGAGRERKRPGAQPRGCGRLPTASRGGAADRVIAIEPRARINRLPSIPRTPTRRSGGSEPGSLEGRTRATATAAAPSPTCIRASDTTKAADVDRAPRGFRFIQTTRGQCGGHSRRWRTGSRWRHRGRAPCTRGRSWPTGWSPARTRRSPSKPAAPILGSRARRHGLSRRPSRAGRRRPGWVKGTVERLFREVGRRASEAPSLWSRPSPLGARAGLRTETAPKLANTSLALKRGVTKRRTRFAMRCGCELAIFDQSRTRKSARTEDETEIKKCISGWRETTFACPLDPC